jgi:hypothetical protein
MRRLSPPEQVYVLERLEELVRPLVVDVHMPQQERRRLGALILRALHDIICSIMNERVEKRLNQLEEKYELQFQKWLTAQRSDMQ